jgi:hypothetical protein
MFILLFYCRAYLESFQHLCFIEKIVVVLELYFALNKSKAQQGRKPETHATLGIKH